MSRNKNEKEVRERNLDEPALIVKDLELCPSRTTFILRPYNDTIQLKFIEETSMPNLIESFNDMTRQFALASPE